MLPARWEGMLCPDSTPRQCHSFSPSFDFRHDAKRQSHACLRPALRGKETRRKEAVRGQRPAEKTAACLLGAARQRRRRSTSGNIGRSRKKTAADKDRVGKFH